jgi:hypothetical protein
MLNTYIKNRGSTQTIIHHNNQNKFNETNWDADYDGNIANISVTSNTDGNKKHFNATLDNQDLATLLNIPSVGVPIDKRLQMDFNDRNFRNDPDIFKIELPDVKTPELMPLKPQYQPESSINDFPSVEDLIEPSRHSSYLSSPLPNEELIVPISINEKATSSSSRRHKHKKTHKTYRAYKKNKSSSKSKPKSKPKSRSSKSFTLF